MKKIIVTGGSGFIGTNFINQQLSCTKNKILNFDKLTYAGNIINHNENELNPNYSFIEGDICDRRKVQDVFSKFKPDVLMNFAAETHVDRSIQNPDIFIETNVYGILNVLVVSHDWVETNPLFRFIHVSTDEVFGSLSLTDPPFTEQSPYSPNSPYSASKASSDFLVRAWNKTYGLPTIVTNCSNNYGPYQFPEKLIPLIINNCLNDKTLPIYGDGSNIRDWLYVEDHCTALNNIVNNGIIGQTYNIGGEYEMRNIDIVKHICSLLDTIMPREDGKSYTNLIKFVKDRAGHDFRYSVNCSKIKNELNWKQLETFETGLKKTVEWYINNQDWCKSIVNKTK